MNSILDQIDDSTQPSLRGTERAWSTLQQAIFEAVQTPDDNLLIQAVAGSGKTTTIIEALRYAPGSSLVHGFQQSYSRGYQGQSARRRR